jgi:hypothetical protein
LQREVAARRVALLAVDETVKVQPIIAVISR